MPTIRMNMSVTQHGPIFDAAVSKAAARRMIIAINDAIAREGVNRAQITMRADFKHPTGYYQSHVVVQRRTIARLVTDQDVVYGGWLEGITERNKSSRFKGYWTFRRMKQSIDRDKIKIARPLVRRFIREMGGVA